MPEKCDFCVYEEVISDLKRDSERNSEQHREFYEKFNTQGTAIEVSKERYTNLLNAIGEIKTSIENVSKSVQEIKEKPAKRWDGLISTIISCVATAIVVFVLSNVGL